MFRKCSLFCSFCPFEGSGSIKAFKFLAGVYQVTTPTISIHNQAVQSHKSSWSKLFSCSHAMFKFFTFMFRFFNTFPPPEQHLWNNWVLKTSKSYTKLSFPTSFKQFSPILELFRHFPIVFFFLFIFFFWGSWMLENVPIPTRNFSFIFFIWGLGSRQTSEFFPGSYQVTSPTIFNDNQAVHSHQSFWSNTFFCSYAMFKFLLLCSSFLCPPTALFHHLCAYNFLR